MQESDLIRELSLISEFMTSQRTITIHILPNISRSKGNQKMKFYQLIKYNVRSILFKNQAENDAGILVPDTSS